MKQKIKRKKLFSLFLSIAVLISTVASMGIITNATLLPIKEETVHAELWGYSDEELRDFRVGDLIEQLRYSYSNSEHSYGDPVEVDLDAKVVQLTSGGTVVMGLDGRIDLLDLIMYLNPANVRYDLNMELIIGSGNQLDKDNIIYNISASVYRKYKSDVEINLLQKNEDSELTEWNPIDSDSHTSYSIYSSANGSSKIPVRDFYYYFYDLDMTNKYLSINPRLINLDYYTTENADIEVYTWSEYYYKILQGESAESVTSEVLSENGIEANSSNDYVLMYYVDGELVYVEEIYIYIRKKTISFYPYFWRAADDESYYRYNSSLLTSTDLYGKIYENKFMFHNTDGSSVSTDDEFFITLDISDYSFDKDGIQKIVEGHYNTMEEAAAQADIKDQLLVRYYSDPHTYKTKLNGDGAKFTVFLKDPESANTDSDAANEGNGEGNILSYRLTFTLTDIVNVASNETDIFIPVIDTRDPWFNVNGAYSIVSDEGEPTESETSAPTESETSEPTEPETSEPTESETSEPTESETSEPTESETSTPEESNTSAPSES